MVELRFGKCRRHVKFNVKLGGFATPGFAGQLGEARSDEVVFCQFCMCVCVCGIEVSKVSTGNMYPILERP